MFIRYPRAVFASEGAAAGAGAGAAGAGAAGAGAAGAGAAGAGAGAAGAGAGAGAGAAPVFADTLPEDIRTDAVFRDIKDLAGLAKSYHSAAKMVGLDKGKLVTIPNADDAEGWSKTYAALGRPEAADKYVLAPVQGTTFSDADKEFHAAILPGIHEAGLSQRQLDTVIKAWNGYAAKVATTQTEQTTAGLKAAETSLREKWGTAFDERMSLVEQTLGHYAKELGLGDALHKEIMALGPAQRPALGQLLAHIGLGLKEDGVLGRAAGGSGPAAPTEATQQINARYADKGFMAKYGDKKNPGHADAVAEMQRLFEMAHPPSAA